MRRIYCRRALYTVLVFFIYTSGSMPAYTMCQEVRWITAFHRLPTSDQRMLAGLEDYILDAIQRCRRDGCVALPKSPQLPNGMRIETLPNNLGLNLNMPMLLRLDYKPKPTWVLKVPEDWVMPSKTQRLTVEQARSAVEALAAQLMGSRLSHESMGLMNQALNALIQLAHGDEPLSLAFDAPSKSPDEFIGAKFRYLRESVFHMRRREVEEEFKIPAGSVSSIEGGVSLTGGYVIPYLRAMLKVLEEGQELVPVAKVRQYDAWVNEQAEREEGGTSERSNLNQRYDKILGILGKIDSKFNGSKQAGDIREARGNYPIFVEKLSKVLGLSQEEMQLILGAHIDENGRVQASLKIPKLAGFSRLVYELEGLNTKPERLGEMQRIAAMNKEMDAVLLQVAKSLPGFSESDVGHLLGKEGVAGFGKKLLFLRLNMLGMRAEDNAQFFVESSNIPFEHSESSQDDKLGSARAFFSSIEADQILPGSRALREMLRAYVGKVMDQATQRRAMSSSLGRSRLQVEIAEDAFALWLMINRIHLGRSEIPQHNFDRWADMTVNQIIRSSIRAVALEEDEFIERADEAFRRKGLQPNQRQTWIRILNDEQIIHSVEFDIVREVLYKHAQLGGSLSRSI